MKHKIIYSILAEPEYDGPEGHFASGDDEQDREDCARIRRDAEWNVWAWCAVTVKAELSLAEGVELTAETCLGGCSYESEQDFKNGGYYEDMKAECRDSILNQIREIQKIDIDSIE